MLSRQMIAGGLPVLGLVIAAVLSLGLLRHVRSPAAGPVAAQAACCLSAGMPAAGEPAGALSPSPARLTAAASAVAALRPRPALVPAIGSRRLPASRPAWPGVPEALPFTPPAPVEARLVPDRAGGAAILPPLAAAPAGRIDAQSLRASAAASLVGAVANRTRPSQFIGGGAPASLLGSTLDGLWGVGEQAALRLIVEGKAPQRRELMQGVVQALAASANGEVARLIGDATQYGEENGIRFLRNLELEAGWVPGQRPVIAARTIDSLFQSAALDRTLFLQGSLSSDGREATLNAGLGYRHVLADSGWMLGINAFYDRQFPLGHQRMSIGVEASTADFTLFANRYIALSGWTEKTSALDERPLSGWDVGIAGQLPRLEDLSVSLSAFHWDQQTAHDRTGLRLRADYDVSPALQLGASFAADDSGGIEAGVRLTYQFGADQFGGTPQGWGSLAERRLAFVNRDNTIHTETRDVPHGYAVNFLASSVTAENQAALELALAGAPLASRYSYLITSSGGGTPVSGSGLVGADPQPIPAVDVSGLGDGTLTVSLRVVSKQGAHGPSVTAAIVKSTAVVSVTTASARPGPVNTIPILFNIVFSRAVTGFELADIKVGNGTADHLRTEDAIRWTVEVTPTAQGPVTLSIPAAVATAGDTSNAASNATSVLYDSDAPKGYSVTFLARPMSDAGFEIANAEAGASYRYSISSSGGGTPVTGQGQVTAPRQQVTGLDLLRLGDGLLTLSLTLADQLHNTGPAVITTMRKNSSAPVLLSITPPTPGMFDDR